MKKQKDYTIETLLFCLLLAILGSMVSCKKEEMSQPNCQKVIMWIDTYRQGKVVKTELSKDFGVLCNDDLNYYKSMPAIEPFCTDSTFLRIEIK